MTVAILEHPTSKWQCPSCGLQHLSRQPRLAVPMHNCRKLAGMLTPMTEVIGDELDRQVRHVVVEREDYIGDELVQTDDNGRPIMAIRTERGDGSNDVHVYAPTAIRIGE